MFLCLLILFTLIQLVLLGGVRCTSYCKHILFIRVSFSYQIESLCVTAKYKAQLINLHLRSFSFHKPHKIRDLSLS